MTGKKYIYSCWVQTSEKSYKKKKNSKYAQRSYFLFFSHKTKKKVSTWIAEKSKDDVTGILTTAVGPNIKALCHQYWVTDKLMQTFFFFNIEAYHRYHWRISNNSRSASYSFVHLVSTLKAENSKFQANQAWIQVGIIYHQAAVFLRWNYFIHNCSTSARFFYQMAVKSSIQPHYSTHRNYKNI